MVVSATLVLGTPKTFSSIRSQTKYLASMGDYDMRPPMSKTVEDLQQFVATMAATEQNGDVILRVEHWWVHPKPPFNDFNRDIEEPGQNKLFPEGALGIRADDDFWTVAVLPYEFRSLSIEQLVSVLWPNVKNPTFNPDAEPMTPEVRALMEELEMENDAP